MNPMTSRFFVVSCIVLAASGCKQRTYNTAGTKDSWDNGRENNPLHFANQGPIEFDFDKLKEMKSGSIDTQPWSDSYWPNAEGGITARWRYKDGARRFGYRSPYSPEEIESMSYDQLNMLSPAEKYDIVSGGYRRGWPMWRRESSLTTSVPSGGGSNALPMRTIPEGRREKDWQGKCHAWTPAALHYPEPGTVDIEATKRDGSRFKVHFGSSDIKALLIIGYDMFLNNYPQYSRVGNRCEQNLSRLEQGSNSSCLDSNAGSFFCHHHKLCSKRAQRLCFGCCSGRAGLEPTGLEVRAYNNRGDLPHHHCQSGKG
jgi:hypothetical protein